MAVVIGDQWGNEGFKEPMVMTDLRVLNAFAVHFGGLTSKHRNPFVVDMGTPQFWFLFNTVLDTDRKTSGGTMVDGYNRKKTQQWNIIKRKKLIVMPPSQMITEPHPKKTPTSPGTPLSDHVTVPQGLVNKRSMFGPRSTMDQRKRRRKGTTSMHARGAARDGLRDERGTDEEGDGI
jgi:hypothetical protein